MFKGKYLRVLTPVTSDGISPVVENDRIKYREDLLPITAQKMLEKKNERLPSGLRKKIEVVEDFTTPTQVTARATKAESFTEPEDFDDNPPIEPPAQQPANEPPKKKGGRPKKDDNG